MNNSIEVNDLSFTYSDGTSALENVSFKIREGERVSIVGPNGAGKSTLLLLIAGLRKATSGNVSIFNEKPERVAKSAPKVGLIFQDPDDQIFMPTVEEDVAFGPTNLDLEENEIQERTKSAMVATGLEGFENRAPHHLSVGEKRRVAIAGVLAMSPEILLMDEPTSGLDPKGKEEIMMLLKSLPGTIILVTHDMDIALDFSERIILLSKTIMFDGSARELFSNDSRLASAGLVRPKFLRILQILRNEGVIGSDDVPRSLEELKEILSKKKLKDD